jgi:hypothetical protein
MFKRLSFVCFAIFLNGVLYAQLPASTEASVLLKYESSFYGQLHTQGLGFGYRTGYNMTALKKRMFDFSFFTMKHPKEIKMSNTLLFVNAKSYVYGKMNHLMLLQASIGTQKILNEKPYWGGIEIRRFLSLGATAGFAKPVYLYIFEFSGPFPVTTLEKYDPEEHFYDNIYGRGPFLKGFNEIKVYPGLHLKAGFSFEHGVDEGSVRALETGLMINAFLQKVPVMSFTDNFQVFYTLFLSYHFGNRTN